MVRTPLPRRPNLVSAESPVSNHPVTVDASRPDTCEAKCAGPTPPGDSLMCRADALGDMLGNASSSVDTMAEDATGGSGGVSHCNSTGVMHRHQSSCPRIAQA